MLTTYGMVLHNASQLMAGRGSAVARGRGWGAAGPPTSTGSSHSCSGCMLQHALASQQLTITRDKKHQRAPALPLPWLSAIPPTSAYPIFITLPNNRHR